MKKRAIKSLSLSKNTISKFDHIEKIKGGNRSHTSCLCMQSECECKIENV